MNTSEVYLLHINKYTMDKIPIELIQHILLCADFRSKIRLRCCTKLFHAKLEICIFRYIPLGYRGELSDEILMNYLFIRTLYVVESPNITNINYLTRLDKLIAYSSKSNIQDDDIKKLNLRYLDIDYNRKIFYIDHMTRLEVLFASNNNITNKQIMNLFRLKKLYIGGNNNIINIDHLTNLEVLNVSGICGVCNVNLNTNLKKLFMSDNTKITNVCTLTKLQVLVARSNCMIFDINQNTNLIKLDLRNNPKITDINCLTKLQVLDCSLDCGLGTEGIVNCIGLTKIISLENFKIKKLIN